LHEYTQRPAIGNGMMNREDQYMVIRGPTERFRPIKRALHQIEWLPENFSPQLFNSLFMPLRRRKLAVAKIGLAVLANHLQWPLFSWKEGEAHHILAIHHSLKRSLARGCRDNAPDLDEAADVIRNIPNGYR
jgi:hypothetical protein